eukprot:gene9187-biopygen11479
MLPYFFAGSVGPGAFAALGWQQAQFHGKKTLEDGDEDGGGDRGGEEEHDHHLVVRRLQRRHPAEDLPAAPSSPAAPPAQRGGGAALNGAQIHPDEGCRGRMQMVDGRAHSSAQKMAVLPDGSHATLMVRAEGKGGDDGKDTDEGKDPDEGGHPDEGKDADEGKDPDEEKDPDEGKVADEGKDTDEGKELDEGKDPDEGQLPNLASQPPYEARSRVASRACLSHDWVDRLERGRPRHQQQLDIVPVAAGAGHLLRHLVEPHRDPLHRVAEQHAPQRDEVVGAPERRGLHDEYDAREGGPHDGDGEAEEAVHPRTVVHVVHT